MLAKILLMSAMVQAAPEQAERIVTIGPGITEMVYDLGYGQSVIATDVSSQTPSDVRKLPKVGYYRQLSAEGLLSLKLDRIIGTEEMGPPIVLEQLMKAGVKVSILPGGTNVESLQRRINKMGEVLGKPEQSQQLWQSVDKHIARANSASKNKKPLKVIFVMAHTGTTVLAGANTTAGTLISLAGGVNPAEPSFSGYKPVSAESLLLMAPDVILVGQSTLDKEGSVQGVMKLLPGIKATPAGSNGRVLAVDDAVLMGGLGPRIGQVAYNLAEKIYTPTH